MMGNDIDEAAVLMAEGFVQEERHGHMDAKQFAHALLARLYHNNLIAFPTEPKEKTGEM
jgi:hypothetical protein